jgi:glycosyltransferase involved in cell wall biosynthesis
MAAIEGFSIEGDPMSTAAFPLSTELIPSTSASDSTQPLRVCHISLTLKTGGLERLLADMARLHDRSACQMDFLAIQEVGRFADAIRDAGCTVHQLAPAGRLGRLRQMIRIFREQRYDVIHTHNTYPHLYGTWAARWAGVPVVLQTRHGQRIGHGRWSQFLYRTAARGVDRIVPVSHDAAKLTINLDGVPREKVSTIWNGIDLDDFEYRGPCAEPVAICVARMSPEKDFPTLLRAMQVAVRDLPALSLKLVGDGPERQRLEELAGELGITDRVEFLGECKDVPQQLAKAAMFVTSSLTEGISLTLLEAMAVGLPAVATAVGGNSEIVVDGETGRLVPSRDPQSLARALVELGRDALLRNAWGRAGRERVDAHFDVRRMVADYETLYRQLIVQTQAKKH